MGCIMSDYRGESVPPYEGSISHKDSSCGPRTISFGMEESPVAGTAHTCRRGWGERKIKHSISLLVTNGRPWWDLHSEREGGHMQTFSTHLARIMSLPLANV